MRWIYRIVMAVLAAILVSALTLLTTGFVVNAYVQSLLGSLNIKWEGQPSSFTSLVRAGFGGSSGQSGAKKTDDQGQAGQDPSTADAGAGDDASSGAVADIGGGSGGEDKPADQDEQDNGGSGATSGTDRTDGTDGTEDVQGSAAPEDALPVMGGTSSTSGEAGAGSTEEPVVTPDELAAKKDDMSQQEKEEVFSMLMNKLPEEEMQKISAAMEGGLTESELIDIQQILSKYLNKDDYSKMIGILNK